MFVKRTILRYITFLLKLAGRMDRIKLKEFGSHLRQLRIERNLTQEKLAFKGDFDRNYIGMLERGERNPSLLNLIRLSNALSLSLKDLIDY
jgi:transcriptional regulator with XRE-family HTH domain